MIPKLRTTASLPFKSTAGRQVKPGIKTSPSSNSDDCLNLSLARNLNLSFPGVLCRAPAASSTLLDQQHAQHLRPMGSGRKDRGVAYGGILPSRFDQTRLARDDGAA